MSIWLYAGGNLTLGNSYYRERHRVLSFRPNEACTGMENSLTECGGIKFGICPSSAVAVIACQPTGKSRGILSLLILICMVIVYTFHNFQLFA